MKELAKSIEKYVQHMRDSGLNTSVHYDLDLVRAMPNELFDILRVFNVHTNPYCMWVKRQDRHRCIESQQRLIDEGFSGLRTCHAGVMEYITPFYKNGKVIGIVAISGYKGKSNIKNEELWQSALSDSEFPSELASTLVTPLIIMLEKLFENDFKSEKSEYNLILQYLGEYFESATLDSVCHHFHRSRSHISHSFKANSGMSIRAYCNSLKLEEARKRLLSEDASITKIALDSGFGDVSYFINLFKQKYGMSPLAYKKNSHN